MDSLKRYRGDSFKFGVVYKDDEGTPQNITGYQIKFKLATYSEATDGVTITRDDPHGAFIVIVSAALMAQLTANYYKFEIVFITPEGLREHLFVYGLSLQEGA